MFTLLLVGWNWAPLVKFFVKYSFDVAKVPIIFIESHSYLTGVTAAELQRHLSNMNVTLNKQLLFLAMMKKREINGTEEIGFTTPIPEEFLWDPFGRGALHLSSEWH